MKTGAHLKKRQGGAVAIMVGVGLVMIIGFLALVIDLGHLYLAKTGQQNAADAAALSGAKELDGTEAGIDRAVIWAQKQTANGNDNTVQRNRFFGNLGWEEVALPTSNIHFGDAPYTSNWKTVSDAKISPAGLYFIKVDTQTGDMGTWFASIWNIFNISTFGMAVAGKGMADISPLVICKLDDDPTNPNPTELGYERGVSYNVPEVTPLGGGNKFWLDALEMPPTPCTPNNSSEQATIPYACTGKIGYMPVIGKTVWLNTGHTTPQLEALNSRFDQYPNSAKCDPVTAPPDSNIKEYSSTDSTAGSPSRWMNPDPAQQSITTVSKQPIPWNTRTFSSYGVLWSSSRPVAAAGDVTDADVSTRWSAFYHAASGAATNYPQSSPYAQSAGDFFQPPSHTAKPGRRLLNLVIVDCPTGNGSCQEATVRGIGRFFMQKQATSGNLNLEFDKLLTGADLPPNEIRLYR